MRNNSHSSNVRLAGRLARAGVIVLATLGFMASAPGFASAASSAPVRATGPADSYGGGGGGASYSSSYAGPLRGTLGRGSFDITYRVLCELGTDDPGPVLCSQDISGVLTTQSGTLRLEADPRPHTGSMAGDYAVTLTGLSGRFVDMGGSGVASLTDVFSLEGSLSRPSRAS